MSRLRNGPCRSSSPAELIFTTGRESTRLTTKLRLFNIALWTVIALVGAVGTFRAQMLGPTIDRPDVRTVEFKWSGPKVAPVLGYAHAVQDFRKESRGRFQEFQENEKLSD